MLLIYASRVPSLSKAQNAFFCGKTSTKLRMDVRSAVHTFAVFWIL
jgi:hypothetical protein